MAKYVLKVFLNGEFRGYVTSLQPSKKQVLVGGDKKKAKTYTTADALQSACDTAMMYLPVGTAMTYEEY